MGEGKNIILLIKAKRAVMNVFISARLTKAINQ
jgi:hypothetical protein